MEAQDALYAAAEPGHKPKTVILIEEAHEFVSAGRVRQMPTLFEQIQRIARRGRKRWLGLVFATQFPQHLPAEPFTLCNNHVLLPLGDGPTIHKVGGLGAGLDRQRGRLKRKIVNDHLVRDGLGGRLLAVVRHRTGQYVRHGGTVHTLSLTSCAIMGVARFARGLGTPRQ
jgi:hypothetical protein